jgi:hypothetical protein
VHPEPAKVVVSQEEFRVGDEAAGTGIGIELRRPGANAVGIEHLVPCPVKRIGDIDPLPVPAQLHHLRSASELYPWRRRVRLAAHNSAEAHRPGLPRVKRVAYVELLEFACGPTRDVQPAVVNRQVDVGDERQNGPERLQCRG